ncbi:unnamed protein product [Adineta steineri]|uniref:Ferric-chelate reductase 1 n=1 Tax=Adineta steineri TaxID=433720 RepID=A0A814LUD4_9BILA|nr:unnamed protein product [Adineta steineri]CAF1415835.1 unnamed protein product [Adineta steineri]CAF1437192.1 unnamed protein product [Adineta steineri]
MMPNHDIPAQQCQPKYIIQADKSEYDTNDIIRITVRAPADKDYFRGILLIAKNENNQQIIGTWSITNSSIKTIACDEIENTGITHVSLTDKIQIEALWHSPSILPAGNTIIKATIVKSYGEIYVDCFNITLKPKQNNNAPQVQSTIINTERDTSRKTNTNVMWNYANNIVTVTMNTEQVNIGEWHAIGFSLDQQMGDEYVFICQVSATGVTSLRRMHTKAGKRPPSTTVEKVNVTSAVYENGRTTCQFSFETISGQATDEPAPIVTGKDYYLIFAAGVLRTEEQVAKHNLTFVSSKTYQLQNSETINFDESATTTPMPITTTAPSTSDIRGNISWTYTNGVTDVKMIITNLKISQWLAIGLSTDDSMGQDHVFICQHLADNTISLQRFLNPDGHARPVLANVLPNVGGTFNVSRQKIENGIAYCDFTLSNFVNAKRQTRQLLIPNLSQTASYQPLIAMGNLDSSNMLIRHARNARTPLSKNVLLNQPEIINLDELVTTTTTASPATDIRVNVSWTYTNGVTDVRMIITNLKISQWLAIGLSTDDSMGQDHVFICQHLADNTISLQRFINPNGHERPVLANDLPNVGGTFNVSRQKLENGIAHCDFTLSNFGNARRHSRQISFPELSQTTTYQPLIAFGFLDSSNVLQRHSQNARTALSEKVLLNRAETIVYNIGSTGSDSTALMKAHGIIMIFAWIVLVSTGILIARYFKKSWSTRKICGKAVWFAIHRTLMTSVAILTLIAFILILVYKKGQWISQKNQREFAHSIVGILVISFAVIQPFMALFRCNPDDDYRFIFNYAHAFVGFSAFILSIVAIFLAMFFTQFNFQANKEWAILVTWTCWLPIIFIIFEIIEYYFQKHINNEKTNSYNMNDRHGTGTTKTDTIESKENATKSRIKSFFLLVHFIIAFGLSLALMILIGQA